MSPPGDATRAPAPRCPQAAARCALLSSPLRVPVGPSIRGIPLCRGPSSFPARRRRPRRRRRDGGPPVPHVCCGEDRRSLGGAPAARRGPRLRETGSGGGGRADARDKARRLGERVCRQGAGARPGCESPGGGDGPAPGTALSRTAAPAALLPSLDLRGLVPVPEGWGVSGAGLSSLSSRSAGKSFPSLTTEPNRIRIQTAESVFLRLPNANK